MRTDGEHSRQSELQFLGYHSVSTSFQHAQRSDASKEYLITNLICHSLQLKLEIKRRDREASDPLQGPYDRLFLKRDIRDTSTSDGEVGVGLRNSIIRNHFVRW